MRGLKVSKETLAMVLGVPLIIVVVFLAPSFLKSSPIEITKAPVNIEKKVFDKNVPPAQVGRNESTTVYEFLCDSDVDYDLQEDVEVSKDKWQVRLTVNRVRLSLKLPITVWLSQSTPNRRADYEDGHAKICSRVFVDAHVPATKACRNVIGRTFFGEGKDRKTAIANALAVAKQEIRDQYVQSVDTKVQDVFVIYDFYAPTWRQSADVLVDKALEEYEVGKPRKLSHR